ncbi:MAG: carboxylating nicotinate-nucleotide diphosphorylase [Chloroflexota bacterium]
MKFTDFSSIEKLVGMALEEDLKNGDPSSNIAFSDSDTRTYKILLKQQGVVAGIDVAGYVFKRIDPNLKFTTFIEDSYSAATKVAEITGLEKSILKGERTALNFLQRMSGVATYTFHLASLIVDLPVDLIDTRKTIPGWRVLDKYSVRAGGGKNHRMDLGEVIMFKDNHIYQRNISQLIQKSRDIYPDLQIELEAENHSHIDLALKSGVDIIMLDNWNVGEVKDVVEKIRLEDSKVIIEISGGIDQSNIRDYASCLPDRISVGSLTHSARSVDLSIEPLE